MQARANHLVLQAFRDAGRNRAGRRGQLPHMMPNVEYHSADR